ncbi:hypothetical protein SAMN04488557_4110 [Hyphomicrobium facile]|uniref:Uncharacterized protein n=1 Tax=Hyphomicrobium facile TaxID=51670 RepID=A0A1I7NWP5_9HYPH|nr:hypothetical protein SAMN04488557_4110 [Hyphomicrobium facile]
MNMKGARALDVAETDELTLAELSTRYSQHIETARGISGFKARIASV